MDCDRQYLEKEYAIWGAGRIGEAAFVYFNRSVNIVCYIDADETKWETELNGLKICSPDILQHKKLKVIIAMKNGQNNVKRCLEERYHITDYTVFSFYQTNYSKSVPNETTLSCEEMDFEKESVIICCTDGLGNQMFQYALYRNMKNRGKNVYFDISSYDAPGPNIFYLKKAFPDIPIRICKKTDLEQFCYANCGNIFNLKNFQIYVEPTIKEEKEKRVKEEILHINNGVIRGYYQCWQYPEEVRTMLLRDFSFPKVKENALSEIADEIQKVNAVSVHIRRGDYLGQSGVAVYGDICSDTYYRRAIDYFNGKEENTVFYFFSNEIEWVRENLKVKNGVYIKQSMFQQYEDWYDMFLMSCCKHNIIANSTFSWWGAWLNQNPKKIVIAPKKWFNGTETPDICPPDWVRI